MTDRLHGADRAARACCRRTTPSCCSSRSGAASTALRDFFDLFNHRLISLFYRAWEKYRFPIAHEQASRPGAAPDSFTESLYAHFGMGTARAPGPAAGRGSGLRLLRRAARPAAPLRERARGDARRTISRCRRRSRSSPGSGCRWWRRTGRASGEPAGPGRMIAGHTMSWDAPRSWASGSGTSRPGSGCAWGRMGYAEFLEFLPAGDRAFRALVQLTRFFVGQEFDFDVQLVLKARGRSRGAGWATGAGRSAARLVHLARTEAFTRGCRRRRPGPPLDPWRATRS